MHVMYELKKRHQSFQSLQSRAATACDGHAQREQMGKVSSRRQRISRLPLELPVYFQGQMESVPWLVGRGHLNSRDKRKPGMVVCAPALGRLGQEDGTFKTTLAP